jgi:hypothetical protein
MKTITTGATSAPGMYDGLYSGGQHGSHDPLDTREWAGRDVMKANRNKQGG